VLDPVDHPEGTQQRAPTAISRVPHPHSAQRLCGQPSMGLEHTGWCTGTASPHVHHGQRWRPVTRRGTLPRARGAAPGIRTGGTCAARGPMAAAVRAESLPGPRHNNGPDMSGPCKTAKTDLHGLTRTEERTDVSRRVPVHNHVLVGRDRATWHAARARLQVGQGICRGGAAAQHKHTTGCPAGGAAPHGTPRVPACSWAGGLPGWRRCTPQAHNPLSGGRRGRHLRGRSPSVLVCVSPCLSVPSQANPPPDTLQQPPWRPQSTPFFIRITRFPPDSPSFARFSSL
jgi:hypothetical protein